MQVIDHALGVGIILVEFKFARGGPPEPVLNDVVHRNFELAIFVGDAQNLVLRLVTIFALPESIGPLPEHRRGAGQLTIPGDDLVEFGAVEKVVVNFIRYFRADIQRMNEPIVEYASGSIVPKDSVAFA